MKMVLQIVLGLTGAVLLLGIAYLNASPQIGGGSLEYDSPHFKDGKFQNLIPTPMSTNDSSILEISYNFFFRKNKNSYPQETLPTKKVNRQWMNDLPSNQVVISWLGHSTILLRTEEVTVIADPVFNKKRLPPLYMGPKPFPYSAPYDTEDLPEIDVVLISHDHFDHLDMESIKKLKDSAFYVPLGIKAHLLKWGVAEANIHEFDWYDEKKFSEDTELVFAPARHFSGRGILNGKSTLWGSWIIKTAGKSIYFGGDSGYFDEFKTIGERFGPFDLVMLDNGQYDLSWQALHMLPEEVVQASIDLKAKVLLPIHWGKYVLSLHSWFEPIDRLTNEAARRNVNVATPQIGETIVLGKPKPSSRWWESN
jgi:L-ascorbate metabolism protein UlaG (beta-lactamase superfamily)